MIGNTLNNIKKQNKKKNKKKTNVSILMRSFD